MPTYGYRCPKCSTEFDVVERMADKPNGRCPECGTRGNRLFYPTGIVFKGTGFYKTDSRSSNGGGGAPKRAGEKPDEKPDPKPDGKATAPTAGGDGASSGAAGGKSTKQTAGATTGKPSSDS